jgi:hypothetical protein
MSLSRLTKRDYFYGATLLSLIKPYKNEMKVLPPDFYALNPIRNISLRRFEGSSESNPKQGMNSYPPGFNPAMYRL